MLKVHGTGTRVVATPRQALVDQPINSEWIIEGSPRARAFEAVRADDGSVTAGEWDCTAGRFRWTYYEDEIIRILEGEAHIEIDGEFRTVGPGDTVFFPLGQTVRWHVPSYVRKVFFLRRPGPVVEVMRTFSFRKLLAR